jgi:hypothetical protein
VLVSVILISYILAGRPALAGLARDDVDRILLDQITQCLGSFDGEPVCRLQFSGTHSAISQKITPEPLKIKGFEDGTVLS